MPGLPPLPSPSPVVQQHIASLCDILWDFGEDSKEYVWPWRSSTNGSNSVYRRIVNALGIPPGWIFRGSKNGDALITDRNEKFTGGKGAESWVRKSIPKKWRLGDAEKARASFVKKFACKAPVYHNCRIYTGDGRLLCFCDRKKLEW